MATVEEKILEIKMRIEGADSVQELKEVISDLTPQMTSLDTASEEYSQTVDLMVKAQEKLTTAMKVGKSQIDAQEGSYNALVNKMAALKKVQKAVTDDESRQRLAAEINTINDQLKAYDQANGVYVRNVGNYKSALEGFEGTVVSFGDRMKEAMDTLEPTKQKFESVQKIATGVASGFAALQGVTALLGVENENLEKTLVKVQAAMAIAQGIGGLKDLYEGVARWGVAFGDTAQAAQNMSRAVTAAGAAEVAATTAATTASTADATAKGAQATANTAAATAATANAAAATASAAASTASAAASAADTTAKGAQVVATEGATVAQHGLNAAMNANPIGLIIIAITALIGLFVLLKDDLVELLGGTEKVGTAMDKLKVVFAGVGNVIKQLVLGPIKVLIGSLKTIVGSIGELLKGNFKAAWNNLKDGFTEVGKAAMDMYDVVGNYQEAAGKKASDIENKRLQEQASKREKELNNYIKDMEAKSDKDWKYSEEGKKAYEELYKKRMEMYDKDSDEYKQAQRDMWMYNRDYQDRITKKEEDANKKRLEASKKALEETKKAREKALQEYNTLVEDYLKSDGQKMIDTWNKRRAALEEALKQELITYEDYVDKKAELEEEIQSEKDTYNFNLQLTGYDQLTKFSELKAKSKEISYKWNVEIKGEDIDKIKYINDLYDEQRKIYEGEDGIIAKLAQRVDQFTEQYGADSELTIKATKELHTATVEHINLGIEKFKEISDVRVEALEKQIEAEQAAMEKSQFMREQEYLEYETQYNALFGLQNNYISQMYKRREAEDAIHAERIASLTKMRDAYIDASNDMQLTEEERLKALAEAARLERDIMVENADYTLITNQRKAEAYENYVSAVQDSLSGISQILSDVASAWETSIQAQVDAGEISEEEGEKQMENMRGIQSAIALINSFSSAVSAYQSMASIPYVGPFLGAAAAAAALASGIAQVKAINAVKKGDNGGSSTRYAEITPSAPEYNPTSVTNVTGQQETENLANAMTKAPLKAYVVESDITSTQQKVAKRNKETSF